MAKDVSLDTQNYLELYCRADTTFPESHQGAPLNHSDGANLDIEQAFFARLPRSRPEMGSMSLARAMGIDGGKQPVTEPKVLRRSTRRTLAPNKYSPSVPDLRSGVYRTVSDEKFSRSAGDVRPPATVLQSHLYFCQSLYRLQRGLAAIAGLLV